MVHVLAFNMMVDIAVENACYEEFHEYRYTQHIKQPDAPLGILLINISKVAHSEEDSHEITDADVLKQIVDLYRNQQPLYRIRRALN